MTISHIAIPTARSVSAFTPASLQKHLSTTPILPLHLPNIAAAWPALASWSLKDNLRILRDRIGEERVAEVELGKSGRGYLDQEWQKINMPFGLFLDAFIFNLIPSSDPSFKLPTAYLAQSDLLDSTTSLLSDVPPLPHFYVGKEKSLYRRTIWIGPAGSFTPFHKDPYMGIYTQIVGRKIFHVVPPAASPHLNPSPKPLHANTSQIPIPVSRIVSPLSEFADLDDLPPNTLVECRDRLRRAYELEGGCQVVVGPGESVLIPEGWWHAAEGIDGPGVGVGAWFR
ncbi:hypothetical protein L202_02318 [Cryptococcus amylolentus CBS 6039]|uniref:JmjC domain-containing protein n=2 Tax=Cryptococcus amylolentus TaxID=104669 RepID=A0A1E3I072_9TREE|nr:hypothetical protein L202_02318 [Cryptococcus amylolentus CBS 6039]ODN81989.1 hypothetical protein L202_02318 [Cryptococcus amylolentus CBS 6039]ODO09877.1 hypothetical protein I350_02099 [Cryptococcus amylolentus CBS 6273]